MDRTMLQRRCHERNCPAFVEDNFQDAQENDGYLPSYSDGRYACDNEAALKSGISLHTPCGMNMNQPGQPSSCIQNPNQFLDGLRNLQVLTQNLIVAFDRVAPRSGGCGSDGKVKLSIPLLLNMTVDRDGNTPDLNPNSIQLCGSSRGPNSGGTCGGMGNAYGEWPGPSSGGNCGGMGNTYGEWPGPSSGGNCGGMGNTYNEWRGPSSGGNCGGMGNTYGESLGPSSGGKCGGTGNTSGGVRDTSKPLPLPQQKDLTLCVPCPCDECPVYFKDSDIPRCPNKCGCCNCNLRMVKIKEAQKNIETCECTPTGGPCVCKPKMDGCKCLKAASEYLDSKADASTSRKSRDVKIKEEPSEAPEETVEDETNKGEEPIEQPNDEEAEKPEAEEQIDTKDDNDAADDQTEQQERKSRKSVRPSMKSEFSPVITDACQQLLQCLCAHITNMQTTSLDKPVKKKCSDKSRSAGTLASRETTKPSNKSCDEILQRREKGKDLPCDEILKRAEKRKTVKMSCEEIQKKGQSRRTSRMSKAISEREIDEKEEVEEEETEIKSEKREDGEVGEEGEEGEELKSEKVEEPDVDQEKEEEPVKEPEEGEPDKESEKAPEEGKSEVVIKEEQLDEGGKEEEEGKSSKRASTISKKKSVAAPSTTSQKKKRKSDATKKKKPCKEKDVPAAKTSEVPKEATAAGCLCAPKKQPKELLQDLCDDMKQIMATKPQKSKSCGCGDKSGSTQDRMGGLLSRLQQKLKCSNKDEPDEGGIGDIYMVTRCRQNQIESSNEQSMPCYNKRISYGCSLDDKLKDYEEEQGSKPEVMKMFVEDLCKDIKVMKNTLNRGLCFRSDADRSGLSDHPTPCAPKKCDTSFPVSIRCVRPVGNRALLVTWVIHSFCGLTGYEIWIDDCCKTRLHAAGYDSTCVYGVDVCKQHVVVLHPIPSDDLVKDRKKNNTFCCNLLPDFSGPKQANPKPLLPCSWIPSTYLYDPTHSTGGGNNSIADGPCCCV